ncbi:MAG: hypothetical protein RBG13Loki_2033 [Promethearchaeota archaeon CR_4]|nr:MAG: hypothetical protein RBG13Loki_2033 [Candidatus Lokiarchaeota archaeon CR_4]
MVVKCPKCGKDNDDSAVLCVDCGEILAVDASSAQIAPKTGSTTPKVGKTTEDNENIPFSSRLVKEGTLTDEEIELGNDDFELTLGWYDLDQNIIPDIDLTKWLIPIEAKDGTKGFTVSRKQAKLEKKLGVLSITQLGSEKILIRPKGTTDWIPLNLNECRALKLGDRIFFGTKGSNVVFEVF